MGCVSCRTQEVISSTKDAREIIKQKYQIERTLLGDGVFGKVFLAREREGDAKVVIKGTFILNYLIQFYRLRFMLNLDSSFIFKKC